MDYNHKASRALPAAAVETLGVSLLPYLSELRRVVEHGGYDKPECSLNVPTDEYMLPMVEQIIDEVYSTSLRHIFVIGIGGSSLGTKAIYDAMAGVRDLVPHHLPRLYFVESTDAAALSVYQKIITRAESAAELVFIVISKSGTTTETVANAEILLATFAEKFGRNAKRVVVLSETGSPLLTAAKEQQMRTIELPPRVGGRYSVCTPVGLLPLGLVGFAPAELRQAAVRTVERSLHPDIALNPAALMALTKLYAYQEKIRIHDTFFFAPPLESLGKWYRQLLGESIGKPVSGDALRRVGITPTVSIGSTDLHSVGQLYLGGPNERFTTFVSVTQHQTLSVPTERVFAGVVPMVDGKSLGTILGAIEAGTKAAYDQNGLMYESVTLPVISPETLMEFMQCQMASTMMLGYLLHVNPFDQPQVEQYKVVTKQLLGG